MNEPIVFTGKPDYVKKKIDSMVRLGYTLVKSHRHPDGTVTVKMAKGT